MCSRCQGLRLAGQPIPAVDKAHYLGVMYGPSRASLGVEPSSAAGRHAVWKCRSGPFLLTDVRYGAQTVSNALVDEAREAWANPAGDALRARGCSDLWRHRVPACGIGRVRMGQERIGEQARYYPTGLSDPPSGPIVDEGVGAHGASLSGSYGKQPGILMCTGTRQTCLISLHKRVPGVKRAPGLGLRFPRGTKARKIVTTHKKWAGHRVRTEEAMRCGCRSSVAQCRAAGGVR